MNSLTYFKKNERGSTRRSQEIGDDALLSGYLSPTLHQHLREADRLRKKRGNERYE